MKYTKKEEIWKKSEFRVVKTLIKYKVRKISAADTIVRQKFLTRKKAAIHDQVRERSDVSSRFTEDLYELPCCTRP